MAASRQKARLEFIISPSGVLVTQAEQSPRSQAPSWGRRYVIVSTRKGVFSDLRHYRSHIEQHDVKREIRSSSLYAKSHGSRFALFLEL